MTVPFEPVPPEPESPRRVYLAQPVPAGQVTIRLLALYLMITVCMCAFFWFTRTQRLPTELYFWCGLGALITSVQGSSVILRNGRSSSSD